MTRIMMLATIAVLFATGTTQAGDGKDHIDRRDGVSTLDRAQVLYEGRASAEDKPQNEEFTFDPRREDDR
ncbi:hypothetical protein IZ6_12820 [Terrihabitans soli]|uniref:Uncharacterized protein n=1 Tax=Terrihabitans soli TaxID=708113 RepID=A0A6S6QRG5_9HYPH|nr:hypothetical protein [Terrihabitans soli]BCJ90547.1 hypothetical protein IZ6_12820 [Terrihabitans soli]